jgi:hypothetical protein
MASSVAASGSAIAAEVGREVGVAAQSPAAFREQLGPDGPAAVADSLLHLWPASDGVPQPVDDVEPLIGKPGRTFAQWAHEHRDAFA